MHPIKTIIGNYQAFFSNLLSQMQAAGIHMTGMPLSHLLYRTATLSEYEKLREEIKKYCSEFVETQFNGRAISILILKEPLQLEGGYTVSVIELPAPRLDQPYPSGLESVGIVLGSQLAVFILQHKDILTGIKNQGQLAFITFDNEKTAKFYHTSLHDIVTSQGWVFADLS